VTNIPPTPGHIRLVEMSKKLDIPIFTTNSDLLLQVAGTQPVNGNALSATLENQPLDYIFCFAVGETSWVERFRKNNPSCIVIAFDMNDTVAYLRENDLVVLGDVQQTIEELASFVL
jgi:hypothetical protein